ncbi:hypothetical protein DFH08DRAFT_927992 [Mycena albidolilacea]|uniref:Uncharacterized protein n=1 Tax=Mycena albidolilacea TaxID=1033008 RepID=A0AAD7F693_9AGAR|nr:hypothetical protein DFH08DRAFT_927992 [Mycena albidolilacea]
MVAQEDKIAVQENKIAALEQENSKLWQEIHRLKGPRFPPEIFSLIVESAREDKKALETFSLVCFRWMCITRKILFARIPLDLRQVILWGNKRQLLPLLDNPQCTLFPHVQALTIRVEYDDESEDDDDDEEPMTAAAWLEHFVLHIDKFTALKTLNLGYLGVIAGAMPPTLKRAIRELEIDQPWNVRLRMSALASFISHFTNLMTLTVCGNLSGESTDLLDTNEVLSPPPSSITKLVFTLWDGSAHTVLKWFTDLHTGDIKSLVAADLPTSHPVEFRHFIVRFGMSLCELGMSFSGNNNMVYLRNSPYLVTVKHIRIQFHDKLHWLLNIIAQLPQTVEEITLFLSINDWFGITDDNYATPATWSQLDNTLVGETFPSLQKITVFIASDLSEEDAEEVWQLLPRCAEEKILTAQAWLYWNTSRGFHSLRSLRHDESTAKPAQTKRTTYAVSTIKCTLPAHRNPIRKRLIVIAACVVARLLDEAVGLLSAVISSCEGGGQTLCPRRAARVTKDGVRQDRSLRAGSLQMEDKKTATSSYRPHGAQSSVSLTKLRCPRRRWDLRVEGTTGESATRLLVVEHEEALLKNPRPTGRVNEKRTASLRAKKGTRLGKTCGRPTRACRVEGAAESIMLLPPHRGPQRTRIARFEVAKMGGDASSLSGTRRREMRGQAKQSVDERNGMGERTHRLVDKIRDLNCRPVLRLARFALVNARRALGLNSQGSEDVREGRQCTVFTAKTRSARRDRSKYIRRFGVVLRIRDSAGADRSRGGNPYLRCVSDMRYRRKRYQAHLGGDRMVGRVGTGAEKKRKGYIQLLRTCLHSRS